MKSLPFPMFMRRLVACVSMFIAASPSTMAAPDILVQDAPSNETIRLDTPSGLPVPRFVSLKAQRTNCRTGPSFTHPVRLTFLRRGLPVMVVAETRDHWRKVRDPDGDECWVHKSKLSSAAMALVTREGVILRAKPDDNSPEKARLGHGLIARVETARDGWLKISADGVKGWARQSNFWGVSQTVNHPAQLN